jgi:hypothetical protein
VAIDIQFESADVIDVLVVDFGFLHFVVEDVVLEGLEDLMADIEVDVELLDFGEEIQAGQLKLTLVEVLVVGTAPQTQQARFALLQGLQLGLLPLCSEARDCGRLLWGWGGFGWGGVCEEVLVELDGFGEVVVLGLEDTDPLVVGCEVLVREVVQVKRLAFRSTVPQCHRVCVAFPHFAFSVFRKNVKYFIEETDSLCETYALFTEMFWLILVVH